MEIQKAIKELRKQYNMSQSDLAEILGVSNITISNWENGKSVPRYKYIARMAEMSPDDFSPFRDDDAASMSDIIVKLFDMSDDDLDIIIITAKQIKRQRHGTDK